MQRPLVQASKPTVLISGTQVVAESPILNVLWPAVRFEVPTRLETFESDVTVKISFTTNVCAAMHKRRDQNGLQRSYRFFSNFKVKPQHEN